MKEEKTKSELILHSDPAKGENGLFILTRIMNVRRIVVSFVFSFLCTLMIFLVGGDNEAKAPLSILFFCISLFFFCVFCYVMRICPVISENIRKEEAGSFEVVFKPDHMAVDKLSGTSEILSYKSVKGQYWFGDGYFILVDSSCYKSVLCFSIDKDTFDDIAILSSALERKGIKLIQVKDKKEKCR